MIYDYTKFYGKPDTIVIGDTTCVDPYKKTHWGYNVIEAQWKNYNDMKMQIKFRYLGMRGEYYLLVKLNYFDKNYPYYD